MSLLRPDQPREEGSGLEGSDFGGSEFLKISKKQKRVILKKCVFAGQNLVPRRQNCIETDSTI